MTEKKINNEVTYRLTLLLVVVIGAIFLSLLDHFYRAGVARESERQLSEAASIMQRHLAVRLNHITLVAADLRAFLLTQPFPPDSRAFANYAATLRNHYPELDALVYVGPDRIIHDIYPLAGNEQAIGLDLSKRPAAPYIEKAIREHKLVVDPPHTMTNGRLAVMARQPIFRDGKLLGIAQAILHVPDAIKNELVDLGSEFSIQLRDEHGNIFWGMERLAEPTQSREVVFGTGSWTLQVAAASPPTANGLVLALIWSVGSLVLLLTMWSVRSDYRLRQALKTEVSDTTHELRLRNDELEKEMQHRLAAEINVYRSEQRLREAQQIAQLGNWEWDIANDVIHWSDEFYRIFGINPQECEPSIEILLSRIHPDDRDTIRQGLAIARELKKPYLPPEHRIVLPDGQIRYVRTTGFAEYDAAGKPQRIAGTVQDITTQKLAVMALEESEHKYRAVLEHASDGIIITSTEGRILDVNRCLQALLGYSRDELLTMHVTQIHPPEEHERLHAAFTTVREQGSSLFEHLIVRKDGTISTVEVSGSLITFDNQQQVAFGVFRDISERKRIEAELHQYRNHLEQLVEKRTAELMELNGELESFSYSVSHDLRAPLRSIYGFSTALREDYGAQLDAMGCDYLKRIESAAERMGRLIDDLLALSSTNRGDLKWENISLSTVASELMLELHTAEPEREVIFVIAKDIVAPCDPTLMRSLLYNLLSNAWKFTRNGADTVIEFGVTTRDEKIVYFVRDNGIGFEMSRAKDLFKPFHRLHGATEYEGSGIGLATVQRIVYRHGGQVWAESEPGQGATFYFTLGSE